ncbi:uncharacterized protein LOC135813558 [Sycon ciliatum]|uniref:uncharacterized protein LOC135813558 n=1 Tax=Sycon ciliatum TaxID=27933 RepID=UPI0031F712CC
MKCDESTDAFVADLKRLAELSGHKVTDDKDPVVVQQLLKGLPADYNRQVRLSLVGKDMSISDCVSIVRALRISDASGGDSVSAAASSGGAATRSGPTSTKSHSQAGSSAKPSGLCFKCGEPGHIRRNCPSRRAGGGGRSQPITCLFCDGAGHVKADCPERRDWLARKDRTAAAVESARPQPAVQENDPCLVSLASPGKLPRMYVDVSAGAAKSSVRARAVVDTGSTRTLISRSFATQHGISLSPTAAPPILALDGSPLELVGSAAVRLARSDGAVSLPGLEVQAYVVDNLSVVNADVLVGNDVVIGSGGLRLKYSGDGALIGVEFGYDRVDPGDSMGVCGASSSGDRHPFPNVRVQRDGDDVTLSTDDGDVTWDSSARRWVLSWRWKSGSPPTQPVGPGVSEYSRSKLTSDQEQLFAEEVQKWIDAGWLVPHDKDVHGSPGAVLPLIAQLQEHKASTPVRPCLDYRLLNQLLMSQPGRSAPVCEETLRKWRLAGDPREFQLLDIKKAYLQVHVAPELQRFQMVVWQGQAFVMTRMGFGLNVAPKFMDIIVRWVTREFPAVDNYVDDLMTPAAEADAVAAHMAEYSLPTKPAEAFAESRVLGLQLTKGDDGQVQWSRRTDIRLKLEQPATKRDIFSWCGRLTGHVPVCGWLRPACSYLKRMANASAAWDEQVPASLLKLCGEVDARLAGDGDPAQGQWRANSPEPRRCVVWADASNIGLGVVLEIDGAVMEDRSWLRPHGDARHINIMELEAAIRGLSLAVSWEMKHVRLMTDSKTVASWLRDVTGDVRRTRAKGLHGVLVQRRLQILADLIATAGLVVTIEWVPTDQNRADVLTRVPPTWVKFCKALLGDSESDVAGAAVVLPGPIPLAKIVAKQGTDDQILAAVAQLESGATVTAPYAAAASQLEIDDGVLVRSIKLPVEGLVRVPVVPQSLVADVVSNAHQISGHASWEVMYRMIRSRCFFPGIASACHQHVDSCTQCKSASGRKGARAAPTRADIPGSPWSEVTIDTLELGGDGSGKYGCVLVCVDNFTKWVEVCPLRRHDAVSVAAAFSAMCFRWGAPEVVRLDNGVEFRNAIVESLFRLMGVRVRTGAVRHPQSQGTAERFNRTLLTLIRKTLEESPNWRADLDVLLFYYRNRPHGSTHLSPMVAMSGWQPRHIIIDDVKEACDMTQWASELSSRVARVRDIIETELSARDFIDSPNEPCAYSVGDPVLLLRPGRRQKRLSPYEPGWSVAAIVSPSTVVIARQDERQHPKTVNVDLLKPDSPDNPVMRTTAAESQADDGAAADANEEPDLLGMELMPAQADAPDGNRYSLRDRNAIQPPVRYS